MIDFEPIDLHQREWTEHPSEHEEHEPFADHVKIVVAITEEGEAHVVSWHPYCRGVDEELANIGPSEMFSHLDTPAAIRFVSFEPLLGVISPSGLRTVFTKGIHWAIVGGESGPKARTMEEVWAEHIVDAGKATKTPVFVKQMGDVWKRENKAKASKAGDPAEWPESLRVREFPTSEVAL